MNVKRIAIHSVPRSGSTWLGNIFNSHPNVSFKFQPLFSYAFKGRLSEVSSKEDIINFFNDIKMSSDSFINQEAGIQKGIVPSFRKEEITHICYKEVRYHNFLRNMLERDKELIVIGLIRNPLAVVHSWLNAPKEFKKELGWTIREEWRNAPKKNLNKPEEFNGYEKWKEVTALFDDFQRWYPERFFLVNYEDLLDGTKNLVQNIFEFCGLTLVEQTKDFLFQSSSIEQEDRYSVYKTKTKDEEWKHGLPNFIINEIINDSSFIKFNQRYHWV